MPVLWRHNRSSNLDKAKIIVFLLPFLSASHPQSSPDCLSWCLVPLALTGFVRCSVPQFSSSPARPLTPHHRHFGSPSYRFALQTSSLWFVLATLRVALPSPRFALLTSSSFALLTPLPPPHPLALVRSRHPDLLLLDCYATKLLRPALSSLLRRAGSGTDCPTIHSGGWKCRWRACLSLEGGNVAGGWKRPWRVETSLEGVIVAGGWNCLRRACSGLWRCAESPSPDKITLPVPKHPPAPIRESCVSGESVSAGVFRAGESDGS